jgi:tetratricopeptide (TPR) repeat protein
MKLGVATRPARMTPSRDSSERAHLANEGIAACEKVIKLQPQLAEGHYYLALNLAQLARTKLLGALPLLGRMQNEWLAAKDIDETLDYGGPDRYVGLLYRDAPSWPVSLGNSHKAKQHLRHALKLAPNFPENELNMIESCLSWHDTNAAFHAAEKLRLILPAAHKEFAGDYWDVSWKDWNARLEKIDAILKIVTAAPPAKAEH